MTEKVVVKKETLQKKNKQIKELFADGVTLYEELVRAIPKTGGLFIIYSFILDLDNIIQTILKNGKYK